MMTVITIYKITPFVKGLISAYYCRVNSKLYVGAHNKGFTERFINKLKSLSTVEGVSIVVLTEDKKEIWGFKVHYINFKEERIDFFGVPFFRH